MSGDQASHDGLKREPERRTIAPHLNPAPRAARRQRDGRRGDRNARSSPGSSASRSGISHDPEPLIVHGEPDATRIDIAARVDGRVGKRPVERGQNVTAGQLLFEIDNPELVTNGARPRPALTSQRPSLPTSWWARAWK